MKLRRETISFACCSMGTSADLTPNGGECRFRPRFQPDSLFTSNVGVCEQSVLLTDPGASLCTFIPCSLARVRAVMSSSLFDPQLAIMLHVFLYTRQTLPRRELSDIEMGASFTIDEYNECF
jgi:hypothetical protein